MTERRSYHQFCGLARALDRVGERWTLLVIRNLLLGPRRYGELLEGLPGITTNLLAKRLKEMEELGLIQRVPAEGSSRDAYALCELGAALEPAVMELARWGGRFLTKPTVEDRLDIGWGMISLKRRYRGGLSLIAEFAIDERRFELTFTSNYLAVRERGATLPDVKLSGGLAAFRALLFGGAPASRAIERGELSLEGEERTLRALLSAFDGLVLDATPEADAGRAGQARAERTLRKEPRSKSAPKRKATAGRAEKRGA
jgi:DNA-binding HxlR family transcriptional regulator